MHFRVSPQDRYLLRADSLGCKLSFMDCDPFGKAEVKVSSMDRDVYSWCREVAMKIAEELGKIYLPKI